ncbi:MAG: DUF1634 domain-containing protein [Thermoanaerobaculaceae bacterium]|nr:DUF1634 domain-containing protein [Thermoanaerobaculaceae bacterium]MDI9621251.1 DUF1634 domain-containing protein [Acidobacteriota bacterium]NLH12406.1 DUF1634 domain-containing protein [Holophagae bacterium]HPW54217.1 DUF1634 domain-containing protein [Thermoanaerobaculaceae bacterium]
MSGESSTRRIVGTVLAAGVYGSVLLMVIGAVVAAVAPSPAALPRTPGELLRGVASGQGLALMQLGVALLIATPVLRVLASVLSFVREHDWTYVIVTATVLALLLLSVVLPRLIGQAR